MSSSVPNLFWWARYLVPKSDRVVLDLVWEELIEDHDELQDRGASRRAADLIIAFRSITEIAPFLWRSIKALVPFKWLGWDIPPKTLSESGALTLLRGGPNGRAKWNAHRDGALPVPSLEGVSMAGAPLIGINLNGVDLSGADLSYADLSGAQLVGANLEGANLAGAFLIGTNLHGAKLDGAILRGADIRHAKRPEGDLDELLVCLDRGPKRESCRGGRVVRIRESGEPDPKRWSIRGGL